MEAQEDRIARLAGMPEPPGDAPPPVGVIILSVLHGFSGGLVLVLALLAFVFALAGSGRWLLITFAAAPLGLFLLVLARALWHLRPWAWWVTVVLSALGAVTGFAQFVGGDPAGFLQLLLNGVAAVYLLVARERFRDDDGAAPPRAAETAPP